MSRRYVSSLRRYLDFKSGHKHRDMHCMGAIWDERDQRVHMDV